jgi:hypothetical protein
MKTKFETAIQLAYDVFGAAAFKNKTSDASINIALWDTVLYSLSQRDAKQVRSTRS